MGGHGGPWPGVEGKAAVLTRGSVAQGQSTVKMELGHLPRPKVLEGGKTQRDSAVTVLPSRGGQGNKLAPPQAQGWVLG